MRSDPFLHDDRLTSFSHIVLDPAMIFTEDHLNISTSFQPSEDPHITVCAKSIEIINFIDGKYLWYFFPKYTFSMRIITVQEVREV